MKKLLFTLLLCFAATAMASAADGEPGIWFWKTKTIQGNGRIATREYTVNAIDELCTSRSVKVNLVAGEGNIRVEADENLLDYILVEYDGRVLNISIKSNVRLAGHVKVIVPTDGKIRKINATSSSIVVGETPLTAHSVSLSASSSAEIVAAVNADMCELNASSSANIHAGVHAGNCTIYASSSADITAAIVTRLCNVNATSSSDIRLTGEAAHCLAELTSSADLEADKFAVAIYQISVSSSAYADILCTQRLSGSVTSSGKLTYRGECTTSVETSSGGRFTKE